jgi:hypothetical protein
MANTPKAMFRGAATTTLTTTLYSVPSATTAVVTNIIVSNTASTDGTFDIALDGVKIAAGTKVPANGQVNFDIKQVLATTKTITGGASATTVNFSISGMEIA